MPRDASVTRTRILDAAQQEVLRQGFAATSIENIQNSAGISRGTFFYHFDTKDALAHALLERYAESDHALAEDLMARAEELSRDPLQQALIFLKLHEDPLRALGGAEDPGCLFASFSYEAGLFGEEAHTLILGAVDHFRDLLGGKLAAATARHPTGGETDPAVLADMAYGVLQGAFIMSRVRGDAGIMVDQLRQFVTMLEVLYGVAEE